MTIFLNCIVKNCMQAAKISGFGKCILIVGKICMPLANSSGYYIMDASGKNQRIELCVIKMGAMSTANTNYQHIASKFETKTSLV